MRVVDVAAWTDRRGDEAGFLERTWERLDGAALVTFHGKGFDLPVLELRSLKHSVPTPAWFTAGRRAGATDHFDLKELLSAPGGAAPLDLYAKLVGLPGKEDVAGEDVQALYAAGALDRIAAYCMTDVVQTFLLFLRFRLVEGSLTPDGYAESAALARTRLAVPLPAAAAARRARRARRLPRSLRGLLRRSARELRRSGFDRLSPSGLRSRAR